MTRPAGGWASAPDDALLLWGSVALLSALTLLSVVVPSGDLRTVLVLGFLLWAPGAAVVELVPSLERSTRLALAPGVSIALVLFASTAMLATPYWAPRPLVFTSAGVLLLAACVRLVPVRRSAP